MKVKDKRTRSNCKRNDDLL